MKSTILSLAVALSAALAVSAAASPEDKPALSHPVKVVERSNADAVTRGATLFQVTSALGEPARKLSPTVWVYPRFHGGAVQSANDDCGVLVITFKAGTVSELQLVNRPAERILAARIATPQVPTTMVASK